MTKKINEETLYIDSTSDIVEEEIKEVRSSVSYTLNSTTENLILNAPLDYEIESINGEDCYIYGYPDKWELDYKQGNGNKKIDGMVPSDAMQYNCGIVCCLNVLYMSGKLDDISQDELGDYDTNEYNINQLAKIANQTDDIGTTTPYQQANILAMYGISSEVKRFYTSDHLANCVKQGKSIIISVNLNRLLSKIGRDVDQSASYNNPNHSVIITGVVYNQNNELKGFYICNSSGEDKQNQKIYFSLSDFEYITLGFNLYECVVTEVIKNWDKNINGTGNELNNTIKGTSGDNILKGESGSDTIYGKDGNDFIIGDSTILTNEDLQGLKNSNQEINIVYFESENDGNDYLNGGAGNDLLVGGGDNDILVGGNDKDTLYGGSGNDLLIAGDSTKTVEELQNILNNSSNISASDYESDTKENTLYGGIGNDILIGDKGNDTLCGGGDADIIYGGKGDDVIYGDDQNNVYQGNDVLFGGEGSDTLYGGKGDDLLIAGSP